MAYSGKVYNLSRTENFEDFIKSLNIPDEKAVNFLINSKSNQKLDKDGDEYVLTSFYEGKPVDIRFKSGVEFEENIGPAVAMTTFTVDGDKVTQVQKFKDGNAITFVREYFPDRLEVTITSNFWSGTAKRFYVAQ